MVRLIPLPDRDGQSRDARLWINPGHVAPIVTRGGDETGVVITLAVDLKLEGLPMQRTWLATCPPRARSTRSGSSSLTSLPGQA